MSGMVPEPNLEEAEQTLSALAEAFLASAGTFISPAEALEAEGAAARTGPDYEARYNALIEHIPGVIFVAPLAAGHGNAYVSPQVETILGFTQEEWLEDPIRWYQQVHPDDKARWSMEAASLFLSGRPLASTYRVLARDGRTVWFQCNARMVHSADGKPSFIHGIGFDVTELKEAEASLKRAHNELERRVEERTQDLARINAQLKEEIAEHKRTEAMLRAAKEAAEAAARVKSEFMANMSHEIRTPMNGVLGLTSLVLNTDLTEDQRDYLSAVHSSAESLMGIINQVLDFAKADGGHVQLQAEPFDLRRSVDILMKEFKQQAAKKHLTLHAEILPDVPAILSGDLVRLRQVLTNLVGNALKFTECGRVDLRVTREADEALSKCMLRFAVSDTGVGIALSKQETIFEPFVQADGSITREYGGTGLGLAIAKEIVRMMGGEIQVVSEPGFGSTFWFTASFGTVVDASSGAEARASQGAAEQQRRGTRGLRVLVVEDNPVNQKVVTRMLSTKGYHVTVVGNGLEALNAVGESCFDIVLMDVQMPVMDGLSATEAIRRMEAQRGDSALPIIGLTAHALPADQERCFQAGMNGFLSKPFKLNELTALMEELTSEKHSGPTYP